MTNSRRVSILVLATFITYFSSLFNSFVWDDEQFIYRNQYVANFSVGKIFTTNTIAGAGEISNYYRPLTTLSFAIDYQFWGNIPLGYHLINIILHTTTGVLLFFLLSRLNFPKNVNFIITLIFLLHPVQTEAVTYINSRGDSLYSFFSLFCLICLVYLIDKKKPIISLYDSKISITSTALYFFGAVTFLASILSKEIALATLGLQVLLVLKSFYNHNEKIWSFFKQRIWVIGLILTNIITAASYLTLRATVLNFANTFNFINDTSLYSESLLVRLLTFSKVIFIYLKIILIPFPLHMERDTTIIDNPFSFWVVLFISLLGVLAFCMYLEWKKYAQTTIAFGCMWTVSMLVPVSGIVPINGIMYEHWLYLPLVGVLIQVYGLFTVFFPRFLSSSSIKYFLICLLLGYSVLTIRQNYFWSSPIILYNYLLVYTDSARIHNNLAMAYSDEGRYTEALDHYKKALEYGLEYPQIYHNMGNTYLALQNVPQAEASFTKALQINPGFFYSYGNLIQLYLSQKQFDKAIAVVQLAQSHYPQQSEYDILELSILKQAQNRNAYEIKKNEIISKYGTSAIIQRAIDETAL